MKKYLPIILAIFLVFQNCTSQEYVSKTELQKMLMSKKFSFVAERAQPSAGDVNNMINSMPNGASTRMLNLDSSYTIDFKDNEIEVVLPYFGRAYNASYDTSKQGLRFTTEDYEFSVKEGKKQKKTITVKPKDVDYVSEFYIEIFPNGKAYASFSLNDRQPISFDGYLSPLRK